MGHHERATPACNFVEAFDEATMENAKSMCPMAPATSRGTEKGKTMEIGAVIQWIVEHKWWLAALVPFVIAVSVLKARG